jgi:hypothetical protein
MDRLLPDVTGSAKVTLGGLAAAKAVGARQSGRVAATVRAELCGVNTIRIVLSRHDRVLARSELSAPSGRALGPEDQAARP